jgi:queuosine precursor transporter
MLSLFESYPTEVISLAQLLISWITLFILTFRFGKAGIYVYIVVAVILSNIQVMKFGHFFWTEQPVALGTVIFASTFLATDILTEFYSAESARTSVTLGFFGFAFFSLLMILHLWIPPISDRILNENNLIDGHAAMNQLFTPMPALYLSSIISYFISERIDISLYVFFKKLTGGKALWFRSIASASISAFMDTAIFSLLAWKVFALQPVSWSVLIFTYILGSFWPRILISITGVPVLYLLKQYKLPTA